ncbi:hypothetical protein, partial [Streptomyces sp. NPDC002265]|uniref:hypothetical protein n=1 Tax=Streptomyces sp. NPDC002265 TaxID=3154415 RepID=UPI00332206F3
QAALSFTQPLRRPGVEGLSPPLDFKRLVAHMNLGPVDSAGGVHHAPLSEGSLSAGIGPRQDHPAP